MPAIRIFLLAISINGKLKRTPNKAVINNAGAILYDFIFDLKIYVKNDGRNDRH